MAMFRRPKVARDDLVILREWVSSHGAIQGGVEAYVEPQTSVSPTTMVLVAGDGEFIRRPVGSPQAAAKFARGVGIPVYDATRVGLPQRMRDYVLRQSAGGPKAGGRSARERDAIGVLAAAAAVSIPTVDATREDLRALLRTARAKVHPDRNGGDRTAWDAVEEAAHALHLH